MVAMIVEVFLPNHFDIFVHFFILLAMLSLFPLMECIIRVDTRVDKR
uniref:Uncharacterized protein n=1 Tax=Candidatus Kentrum sp. MB TaxID=2138164 RepID=A0A450XV75_9GAMM|nr:MAG: hypothetical protein BECKMB1821G_GA0114241_11411 [Candidatus Kentron sp. MB]VFK35843.1 MAG: hypothetical protein BECKMB1821I_GA0114274_11521 [Candidatus Kentron sp. MB]VFK77461.1 MAG: hypothetical protein BECKMB1821H_GA0114242_11431 [Candidatus Kentron sp. MB]